MPQPKGHWTGSVVTWDSTQVTSGGYLDVVAFMDAVGIAPGSKSVKTHPIPVYCTVGNELSLSRLANQTPAAGAAIPADYYMEAREGEWGGVGLIARVYAQINGNDLVMVTPSGTYKMIDLTRVDQSNLSLRYSHQLRDDNDTEHEEGGKSEYHGIADFTTVPLSDVHSEHYSEIDLYTNSDLAQSSRRNREMYCKFELLTGNYPPVSLVTTITSVQLYVVSES